MTFRDRTYAAFLLEEKLLIYKDRNGIVLAIPRGGVPIGYYLSRLLHLPLDLIISKKIPHPFNEEFAIGAVCGNEVVLDKRDDQTISNDYVQKQIKRLKAECVAKYNQFRKNKKPESLKDKIVILTDDGIATGHTVLAAVRSIRKQKPAKIVLAVPVASTSANKLLVPEVDEFICLLLPYHFYAVGEFYENFSQVSDEEVGKLLHKAENEINISI